MLVFELSFLFLILHQENYGAEEIMTSAIYVFDLDETLVAGDCGMIWNRFLVEKGIAKDEDFIEKDKALMKIYATGELDMQSYLDFAMAPLADLPLDTIEQLVDECVELYIQEKIYPEAKQLIESLQANQIPCVIISASVSFIVKAVAKKLGIKNAIGIDLVIKDNKYTSQIYGTPSFQEGKVKRIKSWLKAKDLQSSKLYFYTDSINDLPLCEFADHAHLVNPCPKLREFGKKNKWPVFHWKLKQKKHEMSA